MSNSRQTNKNSQEPEGKGKGRGLVKEPKIHQHTFDTAVDLQTTSTTVSREAEQNHLLAPITPTLTSDTSGSLISRYSNAQASTNHTSASPDWNFSHIQPKLVVGPANDPYEQEADRIAKQVVSSPTSTQNTDNHSQGIMQRQEEDELAQMKPRLQRQEEDELAQMKPRLQRQEEDELAQMKSLLQRQEEEDLAQMKPQLIQRASASGFDTDDTFESGLNSQRGGGTPLPAHLRADFEPKFGADFSGVRVHTDAQSHQLNQSIQAKAFTTGSDIFFRSGEYNPGSRSGQELIAHELTHTIQQGAATPQRKADLTEEQSSNISRHNKTQSDSEPQVRAMPQTNIQRFSVDLIMRNGEEYIDQKLAKYSRQRLKIRGRRNARALVKAVEENRASLLDYAKFKYGFYMKEAYKESDESHVEFSASRTEASEEVTGELATAGLTLDGEDATPAQVAARVLGVEEEAAEVQALVALYEADAAKAQRIAQAIDSVVNAEKRQEVTGSVEASHETTAKISGSAALEAINFVNGIKAAANFKAELSKTSEINAEAEAVYNAFIAKATFNAQTFLGIVTKASGEFKVDMLDGLIAKVAVEGKVGAEVTAQANVSLSVGSLAGIEVDLSGSAFAGARGSGMVSLELGPGGIKIAGEVEAFVGATIGGEANFKANFLGEEVFSAGVSGELSVGLGFKVAGSFSIENGKLRLSGELAAALGLGFGVGINIEINYREIMQKIADTIRQKYDEFIRARQGYHQLVDEDIIANQIRSKIQGFKAKRVSNPVKYGKVTAIKELFDAETKKVKAPPLTREEAQGTKDLIWNVFQEQFPRDLEHLTFASAPHPEASWSVAV